jgi:ATP-binding cassette, subfamily A (ABC1), member 5
MKFKSQLIGLLIRNVKLKRRNTTQTMSEVYTTLVFFGCILLYFFLFKNTKYPPEQYEPTTLGTSYNKIFINPINDFTKSIGENLQKNYRIQYFNNTDEMKQLYLELKDSVFGIEFEEETNEAFTYTIFNKYDDKLFDKDGVKLTFDGRTCRKENILTRYNCGGSLFLDNGFAKVQYDIDNSIKTVRERLKVFNYQAQNMPKNEFIQENFLFTAITSYYFNLLYIKSLITFVINVVSEKEKKMKESMRMMGLSDLAFW